MTIAVVIIAAGRRSHLANTLAAIAAQTLVPDDVVVVDMRPQCSVADLVEPPARWVPLADAHGEDLALAAARNVGAATTGTDTLIFLDVDCIAAPDLIARYDEVLSDRPVALPAVRFAIYAPTGPLAAATSRGGRPDRLVAVSDLPAARPAPRGRRIRDGADHELFWSLSFGCRRTTWDIIGGFDEGYRGYGAEDTDFAFRARSCGVPLAWFAGGTAFHQWHRATRNDAARLPGLIANARRFHNAWGTWPMAGWLEELHRQGRVVFDAAGDRLELVPRPLTFARSSLTPAVEFGRAAAPHPMSGGGRQSRPGRRSEGAAAPSRSPDGGVRGHGRRPDPPPQPAKRCLMQH